MPKSGDHKMIRGHAINWLHVFDVPQKFKVMSLMVETIVIAIEKGKYSPSLEVAFKIAIPAETGCKEAQE